MPWSTCTTWSPGCELADEVAGHDALPAGQAPHAGRAEQLAVGQHDAARSADGRTRPRASRARGRLAARRRQLAQLGDRRGRPPASSSSSPTRLAWSVVTTTGRPAGASSTSQAPARSARPGSERRGRVAGIRVPAWSPPRAARRRARSVGERGGRVVGQRPVVRQLAGAHEAVAPVARLRVEVARPSATARGVGQDEVRRRRDVVGGRAGGEERGPRLRGLGDVALREPRGVLLERSVVGVGAPAIAASQPSGGRNSDAGSSSTRVEPAPRACVIGSKRGSTRPRRRTARCRTGSAAPGGQASTRPPRCANSPMPVTSTRGVVAAGHERARAASAARSAPRPAAWCVPRAQLLGRQRALDERQQRRDHDQPRAADRGRRGRPAARRTRRAPGSARSRGSAARSGRRADARGPDPRGEVVGEAGAPRRRCARPRRAADARRGRAPRREVRGARGGGHAKDARFRQMGPKGVDERSDAAITAA